MKIAETGAILVAIKLKACKNFDHLCLDPRYPHQHTHYCWRVCYDPGKTERQNRLFHENLTGIEFVASTAHLVQSWEKGLG